MMQIQTYLASELPKDTKTELKRRVDREFGAVPIVKEHVWAEPKWAFLGFEGDELVSFLNIVDREVFADDVPLHFFGLNNVITEIAHRRRGYSQQLNLAALEFMRGMDQNAWGFLFCADNLIPFYSKLGWNKFDGGVTVMQPSGEKRWESNAMTFCLGESKAFENVHLRGFPW